jgi:hypothetical protein
MGIRGMHVQFGIPRGYQDVSSGSLREIMEEIDAGIIGIVKYDQPFILARC